MWVRLGPQFPETAVGRSWSELGLEVTSSSPWEATSLVSSKETPRMLRGEDSGKQPIPTPRPFFRAFFTKLSRGEHQLLSTCQRNNWGVGLSGSRDSRSWELWLQRGGQRNSCPASLWPPARGPPGQAQPEARGKRAQGCRVHTGPPPGTQSRWRRMENESRGARRPHTHTHVLALSTVLST